MKEYIIRMVGDNLLHKQVYEAAFDGQTYRFDGIFEHVEPLIREADLSVINQETILVPDRDDISSFPRFGSPAEIGDAIAKAGFRVVLHATNHSLDKKVRGIRNDIDFWQQQHPEVMMLGLHSSGKDAGKIRTVKIDDLTIALLNYSEKMNYIMMPAGRPYVVDRMRKRDMKRIRGQIAKAGELADLVIVFPHWGCEYMYEPVRSQKKWALFFAECGADMIIGTHPHVVQYNEVINTTDGRQVPCLYSLGNFVSCQVLPGTCLGAMADVRIRIEDDGKVSCSAEMIPLVTHTDSKYSYFTVYPLDQYTDELAAENRIFTLMQKRYGGDRMDKELLYALFEDIINRRAGEKAYFRKPLDVSKYNTRAVISAICGTNARD